MSGVRYQESEIRGQKLITLNIVTRKCRGLQDADTVLRSRSHTGSKLFFSCSRAEPFFVRHGFADLLAIVNDPGDFGAEIFAGNNTVDEAVFEQEFAGLKAVGKFEA